MKEIAALRTLAFGLPLDTVDEYVLMLENTARVTVKRFNAAMDENLDPAYLRNATEVDIKCLLEELERHDTSSLLGSIYYCKSK